MRTLTFLQELIAALVQLVEFIASYVIQIRRFKMFERTVWMQCNICLSKKERFQQLVAGPGPGLRVGATGDRAGAAPRLIFG